MHLAPVPLTLVLWGDPKLPIERRGSKIIEFWRGRSKGYLLPKWKGWPGIWKVTLVSFSCPFCVSCHILYFVCDFKHLMSALAQLNFYINHFLAYSIMLRLHFFWSNLKFGISIFTTFSQNLFKIESKKSRYLLLRGAAWYRISD